MKLGFFTMPMHPPGRDYTQTLKEDREAVLLADRLGYTEAYIGEHIADRCETIPSCLSFIASLAHDTRTIRLGSGTVNLPNHHPAEIAAHAAMIDHLLEGRFLFGIGPGGLRSDMEVMGNLDADRGAMFLESIGHILAGSGPEDRPTIARENSGTCPRAGRCSRKPARAFSSSPTSSRIRRSS
jgi:alkanesulfonate monooxygenase SsuD/methylene tetrahydromethanopterin reductase-like flavin-dependent oxidoreductase (luciferase family)